MTTERTFSPSGKPRYRTVEDGQTYKAFVSVRGDLLHISGPLENKRPHRALYSLDRADVIEWPEFYGRSKASQTRRHRFNTAVWRLIDAANEDRG